MVAGIGKGSMAAVMYDPASLETCTPREVGSGSACRQQGTRGVLPSSKLETAWGIVHLGLRRLLQHQRRHHPHSCPHR